MAAAAGAGVSRSARTPRASRPEFVALDCEMIGNKRRKSESYLAHVAIVDSDGNELFNVYVKKPEFVKEANINYRTEFSGITPEKLAHAEMSFTAAQAAVKRLIRGKIVVGHALGNDFSALRINPTEFARGIIDTADIPIFMRLIGERLQPQRLKILAEGLLKKEIQTGEHDALEDARTAMELVLKYESRIDTPKEAVIAGIKAMSAEKANSAAANTKTTGGTRKKKRAVGTRKHRH